MNDSTRHYYTRIDTPVGPALLVSDGAALTGLYLNEPPQIGADWREDAGAAPLPEARRQLDAYFAGERRDFDLPLAPRGTEFQRRVWGELTRIPHGETISYGELARRVGDPKAARAVGMANGRNPISIVVPCHRVVGASGKLVGYSGGLDRKAALLAGEQKKGPAASIAAGQE